MSLPAETRKKLIEAAFEAKKGTYSPYSKFPVGAALLTTEGEIVKGANIENASYGGTICAERTAIVKAVSEGSRHFSGLAIVTNVASAISPCGMCRQVLREFCSNDMPILLIPSDYPRPLKEGEKPDAGYTEGGIRESNLGELLPDSFGPEQMDLPREAV
ncbi:cytidine deaminase [Coprinopsis sp. MPI-PUGE-AT-0042]|nr:cytidine deaminase [Coprinopsis sp. MPI-PUGE-AT-0042]